MMQHPAWRNIGSEAFSPGRSVLIVACTFPPAGGSGVQRPAKFAKYLARLGWGVRVWRGDELPGFPVDATLLADLPDGVHVDGIRVLGGGGGRGAWYRFLSRGWPDERLEWAARSYPNLLAQLRRDPVDVIFSTFSPPSNHLLAWALSARLGIPWVADFRDLWTDDCAYVCGSAPRRFLDRRLERFFIRRADAVTAVSDAQAELLATRAPGTPDKFFTITNGVDFEDFEANGATALDDRGIASSGMVIAHVGRLERQRFGPELVEGFARFVKNDPEGGRGFQFRVVGPANAAVIDALRAAGVNLVTTGAVDHQQAIRAMTSADVLLLPAARGHHAESLIPGKTFEYLASGRPVWFIGSAACEAWRRIEGVGGGERTDMTPEAVATHLASWRDRWRRGQLPTGCRRENLAVYTRETLSRRLSEVLNCVIDARHPRVTGRAAPGEAASNRPREVIVSA